MNRAENSSLDTVPKILRRNHLSFGNQVAMRKKRFGIWQQYTWEEVYHHVTWIGLGFLQLGLQKGDRVIIIGNNDFKQQPQVANGASDVMVEVLGDAGRHARAAVGVNALPGGVAVEVDAVFEVR